MAKQPTTPAPGSALKFPPNWSTMNAAQRRKWQEENRQGYAESRKAAKPAAEPQMGLAPEGDQEHGEEGAAADYNRGQETRRRAVGDPTAGAATDEQLLAAAEGVDAHTVVAKILRTIADAFEQAGQDPLAGYEPKE